MASDLSGMNNSDWRHAAIEFVYSLNSTPAEKIVEIKFMIIAAVAGNRFGKLIERIAYFH